MRFGGDLDGQAILGEERGAGGPTRHGGQALWGRTEDSGGPVLSRGGRDSCQPDAKIFSGIRLSRVYISGELDGSETSSGARPAADRQPEGKRSARAASLRRRRGNRFGARLRIRQ